MKELPQAQKVETGVLLGKLRSAIVKKQELYRLFTDLAEGPADEEDREFLGHLAYEEFIHLSSLLERYKQIVDAGR